MADGRRSLKRKSIEEIIFHEANSHSEDENFDEYSDDSDADHSEGTDECLSDDGIDSLHRNETEEHYLSEDETGDPLYVYENNDRIGLADLSENWLSNVRPIPEFPFLTNPKGVIKADITNMSTPRDAFDQLFKKDIIEMLVNCTNEYGREFYGRPVPATKKSPRKNFQEMNVTEMYKFIGISLLMAQCKFPTIRNAFSKNPLYYHPIFSATMSGNRYQTLLRTFNCHAPIPEVEKHEKLVRVNRLVQALIKSFNDAYTPCKDLSLDESLLLFRGRLSFRQYIKTKAAKYGIKFYELTTSDGYVLNMVIYQGKDSNSSERGSKTQETVLKLMKPYLNKGHHLFNHPGLIETKNRFGEAKIKPKDVVDYNKNMSGVDRVDQMTAYYSSPRKTVRWYKKVLFHLLDMTVWNSYFLYKRFHPKASFLHFRESLITSLIQLPTTIQEGRQLIGLTPSLGRPRSVVSVEQPNSEMSEPTKGEGYVHCLEKIPVPETHKRQSYFQRCRKCAEFKIRKDTCKRCIGCLGKPPLCPPCFKKHLESL